MGRGINRRARDERYYRAVGRQQLLCDRGTYRVALHGNGTVVGYATLPAAPIYKFLRLEHRIAYQLGQLPDFRDYARFPESYRLS